MANDKKQMTSQKMPRYGTMQTSTPMQGQVMRKEMQPLPKKNAMDKTMMPLKKKGAGTNAQSQQMQKNLDRNTKEVNVFGLGGTTGKQKVARYAAK